MLAAAKVTLSQNHLNNHLPCSFASRKQQILLFLETTLSDTTMVMLGLDGYLAH